MLAAHIREAAHPARNLALEEATVRAAQEDIFLLWRDTPSVIVGRSQNVLAEIDRDYVIRTNIAVARRLSGGGAVYHDEGNLCYTYISANPGDTMGNQAHYIAPVVDALRRIGLDAAIEGRNDISIAGRKVSGNAQYALDGKLCHHGTLLVHTDMSVLGKALRPDPTKIQGKGIASVSARVANIAEFLPGMTALELADALTRDMLSHAEGAKEWDIPEKLRTEAERIAAERYFAEDWIYGSEPPYDYRNAARFPGGGVELRLRVEHGIVADAAIYGDFLALHGSEPFADALTGIRHDRAAIRTALEPLFVLYGLGGVTLDEFLTLV